MQQPPAAPSHKRDEQTRDPRERAHVKGVIREMGWDWLSDHRSGRKMRLVLGPGRRVLVARDGFWHAHAWSLPSLRVVNWTSFRLQASDCFRHP